MSILLIDGVRYNLWTPTSEDAFEELVREHTRDIFGEQSLYFAIKRKLRTSSGIGSIPDGYAIVIDKTPLWHAVEIELSVHPLYDHIVSQVSKFINSIDSPQAQKVIANAIYDEINSNEALKLLVKTAIESAEIHKFLSDLLAQRPILTIIIEKDTEELREALRALKYPAIEVVEFQTFVREGIGLGVHAHLFEPLFKPAETVIITPPPGTYGTLEVTLSQPICINFHLFFIPKDSRRFFPGYKIPFYMETDVDTYETWVSSAPKGTQIGDHEAGVYIQKNLVAWFRAHPELKVGSKIVVEAIEPMKRYRLKIA